MKKRCCVVGIIFLILTLCLPAALAQNAPSDTLGGPLNDFTVTDSEGRVWTASEILREKKALLINLWTTWCGPCRNEFPFLQAAYEKWQDQVEVLAISVEPNDSDEKLRAFGQELGLTFPLISGAASAPALSFAPSSIPTTVAVDRFGNIALILVGSQTSEGAFERIFSALCDDSYQAGTTWNRLPSARPTFEAPEESALSAALGRHDRLRFSSGSNGTWPMLIEGNAVRSSNAGQDDTVSLLSVQIDAQENEALQFSFQISSEALCDSMTISLDGERVKTFSGIRPQDRWTIPLGQHTVDIQYVKDQMDAAGEDCVWLSDFRLLIDEAQDFLIEQEARYPHAEATALQFAGAREIIFPGAEELLYQLYRCEHYYLKEGDVSVLLKLSNEIDPETAALYQSSDQSLRPATDYITENGYAFPCSVGTLASTGYIATALTAVIVAPEGITGLSSALCFGDAQDIDTLTDALQAQYGRTVSWEYLSDDTMPVD